MYDAPVSVHEDALEDIGEHVTNLLLILFNLQNIKHISIHVQKQSKVAVNVAACTHHTRALTEILAHDAHVLVQHTHILVRSPACTSTGVGLYWCSVCLHWYLLSLLQQHLEPLRRLFRLILLSLSVVLALRVVEIDAQVQGHVDQR